MHVEICDVSCVLVKNCKNPKTNKIQKKKNLTEKSKGLRWGTEYLFFFLLTSPQAPIIIFLSRGLGVEDLEDHMIFMGTEESGYMKNCRALTEGGGGLLSSCHNQNPPPPPSICSKL